VPAVATAASRISQVAISPNRNPMRPFIGPELNTKTRNTINMSDTMQLTTTTAQLATVLPVQNIEVTAETSGEMAQCQSALIGWCKAKIAETRHQARELKEAFHHAVKRKWKSDTLKRHAALAAKRQDFYERMLRALEQGYQIVPSFPITAFAIRTDRKNPLRMFTTDWVQKHTQESNQLPAGEGDYKNPFPLVLDERVAPEVRATETTPYKSEVKNYWAEAWKELEFPVTMAKPRIMEATTRAMALKIFDEIGILPGYAPHKGTRPPAGDPMIIATLIVPKSPGGYIEARRISFIIAWHLDTKSLT
jgi:hypothetical protein